MLTLACTVHDAKGGLLWLIEKQVPALLDLFGSIVVVATKGTAPTVTKTLKNLNVSVITRPNNTVGLTFYEALKQGWSTGADRIFYADFDRILHWAEFRSAELKRLVTALRRADKVDYLVLERSPRAYRTHHEALIKTEAIANSVISGVLDGYYIHDYLGGAFVLSRRAAEWALYEGKTSDLGFYSLWPLLTKLRKGKIAYRFCEGLEWETPDRYRGEIKKAGGMTKWREGLSSAQEWSYRTDIARQTIRPLVS